MLWQRPPPPSEEGKFRWLEIWWYENMYKLFNWLDSLTLECWYHPVGEPLDHNWNSSRVVLSPEPSQEVIPSNKQKIFQDYNFDQPVSRVVILGWGENIQLCLSYFPLSSPHNTNTELGGWMAAVATGMAWYWAVKAPDTEQANTASYQLFSHLSQATDFTFSFKFAFFADSRC